MDSLTAFLIVSAVLITGVVCFRMALYAARKGLHRHVDIKVIFKDIRQKMWMTAGLGLVFFAIYLLVVAAGSYFNDAQFRMRLFFLMYEYPTVFVYVGLLVFATFSTAVYLVRMVIKSIYNSKKY